MPTEVKREHRTPPEVEFLMVVSGHVIAATRARVLWEEHPEFLTVQLSLQFHSFAFLLIPESLFAHHMDR